MPESEPDKNKIADAKTEETADPAVSAGSAPAGKSDPENAGKPEKKQAAKGKDAEKTPDAGKKEKTKKPPLARWAKWTIILLSVLCVLLIFALIELACLPRLLEEDINRLLQPLAEGGGVEFRIKTISLTSAEVACKLTGTARDGSPKNVGGIGSLSIRYSPLSLLFSRTIDSIDIENCDVVADYSDGAFSIPAYDLFAKKFQSREKKEDDSAPSDDLNAVIPVRIGRISLSGSLIAEAHTEDAVDLLHIPYAVTVRPDAELAWNKLDCSLAVQFATNALQCQTSYLHRDKKVVLDLKNFALATSAMPGTVRSALPRGLRAGLALSSKAELDLNTLKVKEDSSVEGAFTVAYRTQQGLRVNSETPFSVKMLPDDVVSLTLGTMKGEYDAIPFEVGGIEAAVSIPKRTVKGGFQVKLAESEPAQFSIGTNVFGPDDEPDLWVYSYYILLENDPLFKVKYKGVDVSFRPGEKKIVADVTLSDKKEMEFSAEISATEFQAEVDGAALNPSLKGMTAFFRPDKLLIHANNDGEGEYKGPGGAVEISGGELGCTFNGMNVTFKPETFQVVFDKTGDENLIAGMEINGGELTAERDGMKVSFAPETFNAWLTVADAIRKTSAKLKGGRLLAELNGMTCSADTLAFNAGSDDGKAYRADAKLTAFRFRQDAANLTYDAPEIVLNAAFAGGLLSGEAVCGDSALSMPNLKLLAKDLNWEFPFDMMLAAKDGEAGETEENGSGTGTAVRPRTGKVALGDFEYDGIRAASLDGTILWDDAAKAMRLKTDARLFSITGQIRADVVLGGAGVETECGITIPEQDADLSKDLALFFPQFEEIACTGKLGGSAVYRILPKGATGNAKFSIADADILIPEKKLEAHGVGFGFEIPEIAILQSAPGQTISFKSVKFDKIETGAGRIAFRMESPDTWQIESALLDWCNGHIRLGSITYRIGQERTEAVLYCDRLDLPIFLTQIGLGQISGSGAINGTIPVVVTQEGGQGLPDNVYFEDAFLFSTPGEDGIIRGEIDDAILNADSGIEMELAKDALKDFSYSWVRMNMLSTGQDGDLKLSLQLDGRPNRALYYSFDENTASFVKSATPCIFQGIRLDTNVNVQAGKTLELVDYFRQIFSRGD